ncbi:2-dehydro-3-deoxygalactonokinase [Halomonas sp. TRM85114]|uniref:2-dehydro-3-deoxygalactonokinase n=1 Tax=Halomonas jincaotanensis TaxID=2810616 RepID=UPI001BD67089|nr:2-dehydro-3-deoxygalactonokinase [Halomonas jincaotanensis]MBS9402745.1 2-dehydro-3-deoxygalactonokinase [Halomonas jincaotanensis]
MTISQTPTWIGVDWGSSNLRAWAMSESGEVLDRGGSTQGMLSLTPADYEAALLAVIGDWLPEAGALDVLVCGMAGARQGWIEAPYRQVPARLDRLADGAVAPAVEHTRLRVRLLPGLCQHEDDSRHAFDVMRGEETQLAGLVAEAPAFTGTVCLPGTHAKWARLAEGELTGFTTYLTGELYRLLAERSVLAHSLSPSSGGDELADPACASTFIAAVQDSATAPERFSARLFGVRARDLLDDALPAGEGRGARLAARLSGLVIGLELAGARADLERDATVTLIGNEALCARYAMALEALGIANRRLDPERAVLAGLGLARTRLANS